MQSGADEGGVNGAAARLSLVDGAERAVREWLSPSRFREGDRLPPEHQLATMLGISRGTLRSALSRLSESGEIVRHQGSGTFVGRLAGPVGFDRRLLRVETYGMRHSGSAFSVEVMGIERSEVGSAAAGALAIDALERCTCVHRLISVDEVPAVVTYDVFHPDLELPQTSTLRAEFGAGRTVHDVLVLSGSPLTYTRTRIGSLLLGPDGELGRRLGLREPTACLVLEEVVSAGGGRPMIFSRDVLVPGLIELEVLQSAVAPVPEPLPARVATANGAGR